MWSDATISGSVTFSTLSDCILAGYISNTPGSLQQKHRVRSRYRGDSPEQSRGWAGERLRLRSCSILRSSASALA
ncbi:unnamed protein product [Alternaria burnsii]|nr:unnamed protein product [Alternaria burnsii]